MSALVNKERRARAKESRRQRRRKIVEAAAHLFVRQPYATVTLDFVGRRIGRATYGRSSPGWKRRTTC